MSGKAVLIAYEGSFGLYIFSISDFENRWLNPYKQAQEGVKQQIQKMQENMLQEQRINVQKDIADDKLNVAIDRLRQNADLKLMELGTKTRN